MNVRLFLGMYFKKVKTRQFALHGGSGRNQDIFSFLTVNIVKCHTDSSCIIMFIIYKVNK